MALWCYCPYQPYNFVIAVIIKTLKPFKPVFHWGPNWIDANPQHLPPSALPPLHYLQIDLWLYFVRETASSYHPAVWLASSQHSQSSLAVKWEGRRWKSDQHEVHMINWPFSLHAVALLLCFEGATQIVHAVHLSSCCWYFKLYIFLSLCTLIHFSCLKLDSKTEFNVIAVKYTILKHVVWRPCERKK